MNKLLLILFLCVTSWANIGNIMAVKGDAKVMRIEEMLKVTNGMELIKGDAIVTKSRTRVQVILKDETVLTIGPNSYFTFEDFIFDGSADSKVEMKAKRGFFRSVTGKIGKVAPERFKVKTASATIGIRGTDFSGNIAPEVEVIKCYSGAITVEFDGGSKDIEAGMMLQLTHKVEAKDEKKSSDKKSSEKKSSQKKSDKKSEEKKSEDKKSEEKKSDEKSEDKKSEEKSEEKSSESTEEKSEESTEEKSEEATEEKAADVAEDKPVESGESGAGAEKVDSVQMVVPVVSEIPDFTEEMVDTTEEVVVQEIDSVDVAVEDEMVESITSEEITMDVEEVIEEVTDPVVEPKPVIEPFELTPSTQGRDTVY